MQDPVGQDHNGQLAFIQDGMQIYDAASDFFERPKYKGLLWQRYEA